jgi:hypothetical protein
MIIKINNIKFPVESEEVVNNEGKIEKRWFIDKVESAVVEFTLSKANIFLSGSIEMTKEEYLLYARNLEDRIKELILV